MATTKTTGLVRARETISITIGSRGVEWPKRIARDKRTGQLAEIDVHELGPLDPGDPGTTYTFARGEEVDSTHPAVVHKPSAFAPVT